MIGEAIDGESHPVYDEALRWSQLQGVACVIVKSTRDANVDLKLHASSRSLAQPVTLREVREAIDESMKAQLNRS